MEILLNVLMIILLGGGTFFFFVGVVGLLRMPDVFCRMHATTKCDTMGTGMVFLGLMLWQGIGFITLNILVILVFIWLTNPTAAHYIAKSAFINLDIKLDGERKEGIWKS
ncbi:MAG: monovalent cation/H(+) antiporter subunit G [Acholeplasmataceae bacterium]|nr:monovalent cation/H(+) antiporter subunit G [Acholeplasmataceae bacterium]